MSLAGKSNWDYFRILVGSSFSPGMTEWDMLRILAGPAATADDTLNGLLRKWVGATAKPGDSNWDLVRRKVGNLFTPGDSINDMLRKLCGNRGIEFVLPALRSTDFIEFTISSATGGLDLYFDPSASQWALAAWGPHWPGSSFASPHAITTGPLTNTQIDLSQFDMATFTDWQISGTVQGVSSDSSAIVGSKINFSKVTFSISGTTLTATTT